MDHARRQHASCTLLQPPCSPSGLFSDISRFLPYTDPDMYTPFTEEAFQCLRDCWHFPPQMLKMTSTQINYVEAFSIPDKNDKASVMGSLFGDDHYKTAISYDPGTRTLHAVIQIARSSDEADEDMETLVQRFCKVLNSDHRMILHPAAVIFLVHQLTLQEIESYLSDDRDRTYNMAESLRMADKEIADSTEEADLEVSIKEVTKVSRLLGWRIEELENLAGSIEQLLEFTQHFDETMSNHSPRKMRDAFSAELRQKMQVHIQWTRSHISFAKMVQTETQSLAQTIYGKF
jgi:hypothetical protein